MKGYRFIILFVWIISLSSKLFAQAPSIQWQKTYGGTINDYSYSIINTIDGGYAVVGYAGSTDGDVSDHHITLLSGDNIWLIKIDSLGNLIWNKCYGGSGEEYGKSIIQTFDGGFVIAGYTSSDDFDVSGLHGGSFGTFDFWVVKSDSNGVLEWQKCLGGTAADFVKNIIQTSDSGYVVTGYTESFDGDVTGNHGSDDVWVVKLNKNGVIQWSKALGGSGPDAGISGKQTSDGGYLVVGGTNSNDGDVSGSHGSSAGDAWVIKLSSTGQLMWQKCYGGTNADGGNEIILSNDGGFYILGITKSFDGDVTASIGNIDFWLIKADSSGIIQWNKCYGGSNNEILKSADASSDGGVVMIGYASFNDSMVSGIHGYIDCWIVKVDSLGNYQWSKSLGGTGDDQGYSIKETPDGGYIAAGYTNSTNGDVTFNHGGYDYWVVKLAPIGLSVPELQNTIMDLNISQINNQLNLRFFSKHYENAKMFLYDVTGKKVFEKSFSVTEGINYSYIYCGGLAEGMYFVEIEGERNSQREKVFIR